MSVRRGVLALAGQRVDDERAPEYEERVRQKRLVASVRRPTFDTQRVTTPLPRSLQDVAERIGESRRGADLLAKGWRPALVDLRRVCAMARLAYLDAELPDVEADDLHALAEITLPRHATGVQADYDHVVEAWRVHEPTADVRVLGQFQAAGQPGVILGLVVGRAPSFVEVARRGPGRPRARVRPRDFPARARDSFGSGARPRTPQTTGSAVRALQPPAQGRHGPAAPAPARLPRRRRLGGGIDAAYDATADGQSG